MRCWDVHAIVARLRSASVVSVRLEIRVQSSIVLIEEDVGPVAAFWGVLHPA